jgi:hypothetical protein
LLLSQSQYAALALNGPDLGTIRWFQPAGHSSTFRLLIMLFLADSKVTAIHEAKVAWLLCAAGLVTARPNLRCSVIMKHNNLLWRKFG